MKKILVCLSFTIFCTGAFGQKPDYKLPSYLVVSFFLNDYTTAQRVRTTSLSSVLNNKQVAKFREMSPGIGLNYLRGLTNFIDFAGALGGSFPTISNSNQGITAGDKFLLEGDASVNLKMFSEKYFFIPYLSAGVGASHYNKHFDAILPLGAGVKVNLLDEVALFLNGQYRTPITKQSNDYHFQFVIGFAGRIGKTREATVEKK